MKKKFLTGVMCLSLVGLMLAGCGDEAGDKPGSSVPGGPSSVEEMGEPIKTEDPGVVQDPTVEIDPGYSVDPGVTEVPVVTPAYRESATLISSLTPPEGQVYSELTGQLIDASLENQRPIAVMVDNEIKALPHFGLTQADIVYEIMNSTMNGRITRFMALVKDWDSLKQFGSVRSARTTNCLLAAEYNAVLCHDGGPFYINDYTALPSVDHISGVFSRVNNGKSREFTEYICTGDLTKYLKNSSAISTEYNSYYNGGHFEFVENNALTVNDSSASRAVSKVELPFPHNGSYLEYSADEQLFKYFEYSKAHLDAQNNNAQLKFKNLIIQSVGFQEYDPNGYLYYEIAGYSGVGYYMTDGQAIPITWQRGIEMTDNMHYYDASGQELVLNAGKTYIAFVPSDTWDTLVIQ